MIYFHTAISVNNLEESIKFYEAVFDFKFSSQGERTEQKIKFANLKDKDNNVIELFEHETPIPIAEDPMDFRKVGIKHVAFIVENIETTMDKAISCGAKVISPIKESIAVKRLAFISDPNGIPVELVELN